MKPWKPTATQRAAAQGRRDRMKSLALEIAGMTDGERETLYNKAGYVTVDGHALSLHNSLMLAGQGCRAGVVGGFRQWKLTGRAVRKGIHGYAVWVPIGTRNPETKLTVDCTGFVLGTMFGIEQTDPIVGTSKTVPQADPKPQPVRYSGRRQSRLSAMAEITGAAA